MMNWKRDHRLETFLLRRWSSTAHIQWYEVVVLRSAPSAGLTIRYVILTEQGLFVTEYPHPDRLQLLLAINHITDLRPVSGLVTFLSEPYRSASYEIVIESNQPQVMKNDWSFFCTKNAPSPPMPSRPASISIFTLARCSILLQTLQLVRSRMSLFRYPAAAAAADGERVVAVSQQRRNRIYEHERRQLLLLTTTASCSESEDEESANNVLKRLASSLSRSTPMQRRFWQDGELVDRLLRLMNDDERGLLHHGVSMQRLWASALDRTSPLRMLPSPSHQHRLRQLLSHTESPAINPLLKETIKLMLTLSSFQIKY